MDEPLSVLGGPKGNLAPFSLSQLQGNVCLLINYNHLVLALLCKTKDGSSANDTRLPQSLLITSADCPMFTSKSKLKGYKRW
jgi:hypothetical protein